MTAALSRALRGRVVRAVGEGSSIRAAALRFEVSPSAAVKLMKRVRETGSLLPGPIGGHRRPVLEPHADLVRTIVAEKAGITVAEVQVALQKRGIVVKTLSTISLMLHRLGCRIKKSMRAAEQDRPDVARERDRWRVWQRYMDADRFVFLDETGASTNMTRLFGWAPRGERLIDTTPHGHWKTTTFVAGLRGGGIIAPLVVDGAITGDLFRAYVEQMLAPILAPGDVVVMDNLAVHKVPGIRQAIQAAGVSLLYLPPYSPDFNPIEQFFARLKSLLRKAEDRTRDALWNTIGRLLDTLSPSECRNYIANSGYEPA